MRWLPLLVLALASLAQAQPVPLTTCGGAWTAWPSGNPETVWALSSAATTVDLPAAEVAGLVNTAFATWGSPGCSSFDAAQANDVLASPLDDDDVNVVGFLGPSWPYGSGVLAVTQTRWDPSDCAMVQADLAFNDDGVLWVNGAPGDSDERDLQSVAVHEVGHWIGFDHNGWPGSSLAPFYSNGIDERTLTCSDTEGVCQSYPSGGLGCGGDDDCPCDLDCVAGTCQEPTGDDDDDDSAPVEEVTCGTGVLQIVDEQEPNDWESESDVDLRDATGADLRIRGEVTCGNDGAAYAADQDWFVLRFPCTGDARFTLSWDSAAQLDLHVYEVGDDDPVVQVEGETGGVAVGEATTGGDVAVHVACWEGETASYEVLVDWAPFSNGGVGDDDDSTEDRDGEGTSFGAVETTACGCGARIDGGERAGWLWVGLPLALTRRSRSRCCSRPRRRSSRGS